LEANIFYFHFSDLAFVVMISVYLQQTFAYCRHKYKEWTFDKFTAQCNWN
jgi:hypothetical protein